jgi:Asp-tRNA(Asn)/Glu-tRNA(Gln) amidotransferase A subunit family amidase
VTIDREIASVFARALDDLKAAGAEIVDRARIELPPPGGGGTCRGFKYDINKYLATRGTRAPVHSLAEIIATGKFHESVRTRLESANRDTAQGPDSDACKADAASRAAFGAAVTKTMDDLKLDACVYPTWSFPPQLVGQTDQGTAGDNSQVYAPRSGFPAINVPMGFTRNNTLPAGMTILGRAWSEPTLIRLAYAYEQATHHRRPPLPQ